MKTFKTTLLLIAITFMAISFGFAQVGDKYQFGYSTLVEVESADTINLNPTQAVTVYTLKNEVDYMVLNFEKAYPGYRASIVIATNGDTLVIREGKNVKLTESGYFPVIKHGTTTLDFISTGNSWYLVEQFTVLNLGHSVELIEPTDTIDFEVYRPFTTYKAIADTNELIINAPAMSTYSVGQKALFIITALDTVTVKFNTNITGADIIINEGDKKAFELVNWGSDWFLVGD
mgnify:CR=1 FL=1